MSGLAEVFVDDHRHCDALWAEVETAADAGGSLHTAFDAFDGAMRRHLAWEEDVIFPAFERVTGMRGGPTVVMRAEHNQMRGVLDQMRQALAQGDPDLVIDHGDTLLMLIQQHNRKEEQILYPMAENALRAEWPVLREQLTR